MHLGVAGGHMGHGTRCVPDIDLSSPTGQNRRIETVLNRQQAATTPIHLCLSFEAGALLCSCIFQYFKLRQHPQINNTILRATQWDSYL